MRIRSSAVCVLSVALLGALQATPASAQGKGRGEANQGQGQEQGQGQGQGQGRGAANQGSDAKKAAEATTVVPYGFGQRDRETIRTYFAQRSSGLPPGLAKRESLTPGLEKQLQRNGTLPPGLAKQIQPFPADLDRQLGKLPEGYRRGIVGPHVVVYRSDTQRIVDVIQNLVP